MVTVLLIYAMDNRIPKYALQGGIIHATDTWIFSPPLSRREKEKEGQRRGTKRKIRYECFLGISGILKAITICGDYEEREFRSQLKTKQKKVRRSPGSS